MSDATNEMTRELEAMEDRLDSAIVALARMEQANDERLPWSMVKRFHEGEQPVLVWREHRSMSRDELASAAQVPSALISEIEDGKEDVPLRTMDAIARALRIDLDDLVPWRQDE